MRLKEIVQDAPSLEFGDRLNDHGPVVFRGQGSVVYDRKKGSFVKVKPWRVSGKGKVVRNGFLDKLLGLYEDVRDLLAESYQHGKDLVEIGLKHGIPAAAEYEAEVVKGDLREAKIGIAVGYFMLKSDIVRACETPKGYR